MTWLGCFARVCGLSDDGSQIAARRTGLVSSEMRGRSFEKVDGGRFIRLSMSWKLVVEESEGLCELRRTLQGACVDGGDGGGVARPISCITPSLCAGGLRRIVLVESTKVPNMATVAMSGRAAEPQVSLP